MRTTVTLDDEVVLGIKRIMKNRPDTTFKQVVNRIMKQGLEAEGVSINVPFELPKLKKAKPKSGVNFDCVNELISTIDGDFHK